MALSRCRRVDFTEGVDRVDAGAWRAGGALEDAAPAADGRAVLGVVDVGGGRVDVLRPAAAVLGAMLGRGLAATTERGLFVATGGVDVLEVDVLDGPASPNCFVGDFVGDRIPLVSLAAGVGVPGTALARRSCWTVVCLRAPLTAL